MLGVFTDYFVRSRNAELSAKLEHVNGNVAKDLER
jgi:hypothetical protein